ncbi:hypothetical protein NTE_02457 [Candidatus Nitrososphaera evergladensis SR1]|uniref:Uncharacterized protein n=2 Tax=Nitrososphaera TaxID=497726 RepID=A0A075MV20_9ARCH|nr:hypothetical protein NTE_02457 [Candidatus Nitrososphaera evergladensis SR1]
MAVHGKDYCVKAVLTALADGRPKSARDVVTTTGIDEKTTFHLLSNMWRKRLILRTDKPLFEYNKQFKGRAGFRSNTRMFHLYVINGQRGQGEVEGERARTEDTPFVIDGHRFVQFSSEYSDKRGNRGSKSKAQLVLNFLKENSDRAFYSTEIFNALKEKGVTMPDIMTTARRYERKGLLYVRGYQTHDSQSPFQEGYLITWIEQQDGGDDLDALKQAVMRTNEALKSKASTNPLVQRVLAIRNLVVSETELGRIASINQIKDALRATDNEVESAIARATKLYPSIREVKLFDAYRYFYHESMNEEVLNAALEMAKNYIRISKGRANRIGHNWEACVEWFIDKFTIGAEFRTQNHRNNGTGRMDPRRITLHLIKSVGDRRQNAEVDRVWTVTPSVFARPVTYVLECKWGLVRRKDLDDFFNVLKWSTDFGVDTPEERQVKNGVVGVFAGGAFEDIHVKVSTVNSKDNSDSTITLAQYAERLNVQLLRAANFNEKLRDKGVPKDATVQKICKAARDERDVRRMLDAVWEKPEDATDVLDRAIKTNSSVFKFEEELEAGDNEGSKGKEKGETLPTGPLSTAAAEV